MATRKVSKSKVPKIPDKPTGRYKHLEAAFKLLEQWRAKNYDGVAKELASNHCEVTARFISLLYSYGLQQEQKYLYRVWAEMESGGITTQNKG